MESSIVTVGDDVAEIEPVAEEMQWWKLMRMRALAVTGLAAMALGVTLSEALKRIAMIVMEKG